MGTVLRGILLMAIMGGATALARDPNGQYAQSSWRDWIRSLTDQKGRNCCDMADGTRLEDPDWEFNGESYRVKLDGDWYVVPPDAVINQGNRIGYAIVWRLMGSDGKRFIRCFLPGSGT